MIDRDCPNKSFNDMRRILQMNNVKNNEFPIWTNDSTLHIADDQLKDINRYEDVVNECIKNIWYFFRRVLRIPTTYGSYLHEFELTPLALEMIWLFDKGFNVVVKTPYEGMGVSTILAGLITYSKLVGLPINHNSNFYTLSDVYSTNKEDKKKKNTNLRRDSIHTTADIFTAALPTALTTITNQIDNGRTIELLDIPDNKSISLGETDQLTSLITLNKENPLYSSIRVFSSPGIFDDGSSISSTTLNWIYDTCTIKFNCDMFDMTDDQLSELRNNSVVVINTSNDVLNSYGMGLRIE